VSTAVKQGLYPGGETPQTLSEGSEITASSSRIRKTMSSISTTLWHSNSYRNTSLHSCHDIHKIYWCWPLLLHSREGESLLVFKLCLFLVQHFYLNFDTQFF